MNELIITEEDYSSLRSRLQDPNLESAAVLITNILNQGNFNRLLVTEIFIAPLDAYRKRNTSRIILDPSFIVPIVKKATRDQNGIIFVHTHPWEKGIPKFSFIDDDGEKQLKIFLDNRKLKGPNATLLFGENLCAARILGSKQKIAVITIGNSRKIIYDPSDPPTFEQYYDRQIRLLGEHGQRTLNKVNVGIVGLGGTGSVVVEQLAHLGVQNFVLVDPDVVDETNLNRLIGSNRSHIGLAKVNVANENVKRINSKANVILLQEDVLNERTARSLLTADIIFCCTDSQASRATLNQLGYQYYIPTIDIGVSITTRDQNVDRITGRVQLLSPGIACLTCQELLDPTVVRQEFMTPEERKQDPYFIGLGEPQPAVVSLNSAMSSLAITMFLSVVTDLPSRPRYLLYDALKGTVRSAVASRNLTCVVCSKYGALGKGEQWKLPVHQSEKHGG